MGQICLPMRLTGLSVLLTRAPMNRTRVLMRQTGWLMGRTRVLMDPTGAARDWIRWPMRQKWSLMVPAGGPMRKMGRPTLDTESLVW